VVALRGGIVVPIPPCANTGLQLKAAETTAIINNGLIRIPLAEWVTWVGGKMFRREMDAETAAIL
jgi:hypothetical protein